MNELHPEPIRRDWVHPVGCADFRWPERGHMAALQQEKEMRLESPGELTKAHWGSQILGKKGTLR